MAVSFVNLFMVKLESVTLNDYENILVRTCIEVTFYKQYFLSDPVILKKLNNFYDIL